MDFVSSSNYAFLITHWLVKGNSMYFCLLWSSLTKKQILQLNFKDTGIFRGENMKSIARISPQNTMAVRQMKWMNACNESIPQQTKSSSIIDLFAHNIWYYLLALFFTDMEERFWFHCQLHKSVYNSKVEKLVLTFHLVEELKFILLCFQFILNCSTPMKTFFWEAWSIKC